MNLGTPIARGNTAEIYLSDNKAVKVFKDFLPDTESLKEAGKQRYAYSCGLSVPEVLDLTKINGKQAIIMEHVKGETLGDLFFKDKKQAEYYLKLSIDAQMKIHTITPVGIESMHDKLYRQIHEAESLDSRYKPFLLKRLETMRFVNRLCHGDFHLFNLIKTDSRVVVIDWVDSSSGDIRADVYRTYLLYLQYSAEFAEMYLRLYCEKSGVFRDEILSWAPIIAAARLSEDVSTENTDRLLEIINQIERPL